MNKTQIKELMMKLHAERQELLSAEKDPKVVELRTQLKALQKKLEATFANALDAARERNASRLAAIDVEMEELRKQFEGQTRTSRTTPIPDEKLPPKALEIREKLRRSISGGRLCYFIWISPKQKYGIMWRKGHTAYIDRGSGNCYSQTQSALVDLNNVNSSPWSCRESLSHHEGLLTKAIFDEWVAKAKELEA